MAAGCVRRLGALIRSDKIYLAAARLFNDFVCASTGHPSFDRGYLERVVLKSATSPLETRAYTKGARWTLAKGAFVALSLLLCARLLMLPTLTFITLDLRHQAANVVAVAAASSNSSTAPVHRFLCLATNCSRLAPLQQSYHTSHYYGDEAEPASPAERLARDFVRLPYFSLCYPTMSQFHDQAQFWDFFGLFMSSIFGLGILLGGCMFTLVQSARPNGGLFIMFVLEPELSRRALIRRTRSLLVEAFTVSYNNYCNSLLRRQLARSYNLDVLDTFELNQRAPPTPTSGGRFERARRPLLNAAAHCPPSPASEQTVLDCLPSTRTLWWRSRMATAFASFTLLSFANFLAIELSGYGYIQWTYMPFRRRYLADVAHAVRQSNCSLWRTLGKDETGIEPIELAQLNTRFTWLFIALDVANSWPYFCVCAFCAHFYCSFADVFCFLYEVQFQFDFAIEFMRQAAQSPSRFLLEPTGERRKARSTGDQGECRQLVDMERVRAKFRSTVSIWYSFILCSNLKRGQQHNRAIPLMAGSLLEHKFAMQDFVEQARPGRGESARAPAQVELLTKLYIDFRLLMDQIHDYVPIVEVVVILSTMLNYGYCCTCIWYAKKIQGFLLEPMVVAFSAWTIANMFILLPSNFHAKTRKLQVQIWSLLATAAGSRDTRIEHLRLLWLKQLRHSKKNDGIAFTWFNMRITYVNIIQMMVWTATLCVVTLRV